MATATLDREIRVTEACVIVGCSPNTLRKMCSEGQLTYRQVPMGPRWLLLSECEAMAQSFRHPRKTG